MIAKQIIFQGRVQGVGFRYSSYRIAGGYDVSGFVRNLPDGSVEMLLQGSQQEVDHCLEAVKNYFSGHIRACQTQDIPSNPRHQDFRITY